MSDVILYFVTINSSRENSETFHQQVAEARYIVFLQTWTEN